jgi:PTS system galactitol-specific IIA component
VSTAELPAFASPDPALLLEDSFVLLGLHCDTAEAAIRRLVRPLVEAGRVEDAYADDVWEREQKFPTGLPTQPVAVALPHADPDHVRSAAMSVALLSEPVEFQQMGSDPPLPLPVRVVFLLALKEREQQAPFLRALMLILQAEGVLSALGQCRTPSEVTALLRRAAAGAASPPSS